VELGADTRVLDVGFDDGAARGAVPDLSFDEIRATDPDQARYFVGPNKEGVPKRGVVVGAQLTPPRQFIHRQTQDLFPVEPGAFAPLIATSIGGLGAGWGAAAFTFSAEELAETGLPPEAMREAYRKAAGFLGISGDRGSPVSQWLWPGDAPLLPPLDLDDNAANILGRWERKKAKIGARGVHAGRVPMAILTEEMDGRGPNPYFDMDFYGDSRKSVFRPRYLIERLRQEPNFDYRPGMAVFRIVSRSGERPRVQARDVATGKVEEFSAGKVVLCANALNSGRIVLNSLPLENRRTSVLCNPYTYFPTVNLGMLGRAADGRRHSLAQFGGVLLDSAGREIDGVFQMYSYRSLLLFKLVKEMPLPPSLGLLLARTLASSLSIFGIFFRDEMSEGKRMELTPGQPAERPSLRFSHTLSVRERVWKREGESRFRGAIVSAGCIPLGMVDPGPAGSIHYAGTIPLENPVNPAVRTLPDGTIEGLPNVYAGDSSSWVKLPAKGLSFTLAANGIRVAELVAKAG